MALSEHLIIGAAPSEVPCAALGVTDNFEDLNKLECRTYIHALRLKYGDEPDGAALNLQRNEHDFGIYYEVVCRFDPDNAAAYSYACRVENGLDTWLSVDMWPPVTYDAQSQAVHVIRKPHLWSRQDNPTCRKE